MRAITAIAWKDLRLLMRDRGAAFFVFLFPLAVAVFFGAVFGGAGPGEGGGTIPVSVVNLSKGPRGAAFAKDLAEDKALEVTPAATAEAGPGVRGATCLKSLMLAQNSRPERSVRVRRDSETGFQFFHCCRREFGS